MTKWEEDLSAPFPSADIEWRIQRSGKDNTGRIWAVVLPYITARAVMDRLDSVLGCGNWNSEIREIKDGFVCKITVNIGSNDKPVWVYKEDGAPRTQIEDIKGGISDAFKRAAVHLGVGRYLYKLDQTFFADVCESGTYRDKLKDNTIFRWNPPRLPKEALPKEEQK